MSKLKTNKRILGSLVWKNVRLARSLWRGQLSPLRLPELKRLSCRPGLSIASGELLLLDGKWYVTHAGLLRIATRRRCLGIRPVLQERFSDPAANRWVFKATVYKSPGSKGFVGYGDADPSNVSPWSTAPRCALPKPAPSTAPSARPMASASARSRNSAGRLGLPVLIDRIRTSLPRTGTTAITTVSLASAIVFAC